MVTSEAVEVGEEFPNVAAVVITAAIATTGSQNPITRTLIIMTISHNLMLREEVQEIIKEVRQLHQVAGVKFRGGNKRVIINIMGA